MEDVLYYSVVIQLTFSCWYYHLIPYQTKFHSPVAVVYHSQPDQSLMLSDKRMIIISHVRALVPRVNNTHIECPTPVETRRHNSGCGSFKNVSRNKALAHTTL